MSMRVGQGYDVHRLVAGRALLLGGVNVPSERGLEGHSDGDCLIHAICDALLGAAALGDLGDHFPSSDARLAGAPSSGFLSEVMRLVAQAGYAIGNVDATVIAQAPQLKPHLPALRASLSRLLAVPQTAVSVKVKSSDGLGAVGRGECIAAQAVALLLSKD